MMQLLSTFFRKNSIEKGLKQVKKKIQKKILTGFLDNSLCNIHVYPLEKRKKKKTPQEYPSQVLWEKNKLTITTNLTSR